MSSRLMIDCSGVPTDQGAAAKYRLIMEASNDALLFINSAGRLVDVNQAAVRLYGYSRDELLAMSIGDLRAPETLAVAGVQMEHAFKAGKRFETIHCRKDGSRLEVEVSSRGANLSGAPVLLSLVRDVTARKRRERVHALLRLGDQILSGAEPLQSQLTQICNRLAEVLDLPLVWVGMKDPDGSVLVTARGGRHGHVIDTIGVRWDTSSAGTGPTGEAVRTARTQVVALNSTVPGQPWRPTFTELGIEHALVAPIVYRNELLGTISLYAPSGRQFDPETVSLAEHFASHLGVMVTEARDRELIRLQTAALNAAANAMIIVDRSGNIIWANDAFTELTGYEAAQVIGQRPSLLKSGLMPVQLYSDLWSTVTAGGTWTGEMLNRRRDGTIYVDQQTITPVRDSSGEISHFVSIKIDGTERRRHEDHLRFLANHDPLTGLPNRRGFIEQVRESSRDGGCETAAILMVDLDDFKAVNDLLGHVNGDSALSVVAGLIRRTLRQDDLAVRYGGDELAILLQDVGETDAITIAERLRRSLQLVRVGECEPPVTLSASIGIALMAGPPMADQVLSLADAALRTAKSAGKNQVAVFRSELDGEGPLGRWPNRIRSAIAGGGLVLHFQPIMRLGHSTVEWMEALVRLQDPNEGLIYPGKFLPQVFGLGLMPALDLWVIRTVLTAMAQNSERRIAVNLSAATLQDQDALATVEQAVIEARPKSGHLIFEINETAAVRDLQRLNEWMARMRRLGCRFALDDFGTGASSFEHLRSLQVDVVKIDGSYVKQVRTDPTCLAFVQSIGWMCKLKGIDLVAECVESDDVLDLLAGVGVTLGQGFLWGYPAPLESLCS